MQLFSRNGCVAHTAAHPGRVFHAAAQSDCIFPNTMSDENDVHEAPPRGPKSRNSFTRLPISGVAQAANARAELRLVVESVLDIEQWTATYGVCRCPLDHPKARVYVDGLPFLWCVHGEGGRCWTAVAELNRELRERCEDLPEDLLATLKPKQKRDPFAQHLRYLRAAAKNRLLPTLAPVPVEEWLSRSPVPIPSNPEEHWHLLLRALYPPGDSDYSSYIWCGDVYDTGRAEHAIYFHDRSRWLALSGPFGQQVSTCLFDYHVMDRPSRCAAYVQRKLFTVYESDTLPADKFGGVIERLQKVGRLRAIIDTGGRSIHSWFDAALCHKRPKNVLRPPPEEIADVDKDGYATGTWKPNPDYAVQMAAWKANGHEAVWTRWSGAYRRWKARQDQLGAVAQGLGCDKHMFARSLTARVPGVLREETGRWQRLLYLDPIFKL